MIDLQLIATFLAGAIWGSPQTSRYEPDLHLNMEPPPNDYILTNPEDTYRSLLGRDQWKAC